MIAIKTDKEITMKCLLFVLAAIVAVHAIDEDPNARILASKNILNEYLVEGKDLTVEYYLYNVGASAALNVQLADYSFPEGDFEVVRGFLNAQWERLAPGSNVSHAVIVRPLKSGYFNFTSAEISYLSAEDAEEPTLAYTSAPGEGGIISLKDYDRKFSPHIVDWATFALMCLPSLGIPLLLWYSSKSKYDAPKAKKN
ncbi:unnamed protein product [Owenia fusiformis]|uniref:Translocon-associated protein subunit beta n=1 Tax=Owenia fusiformis TaxID=6347 RepID=A0A8J1XU60_OWEFU|nr:unnamed protein product [Owenia fusiformis]